MQKHLNLIRKLAWSFHQTTQIEWNDLFSEACLAYCEAIPKFDKSRASESTLIYTSVKNRLYTYVQKEQRNKVLTGLEYAYGQSYSPAHLFEFTEQFEGDSKFILEIILADKVRFAKMTPKEARGEIARILKTRGWNQVRIWDAIRKMKVDINQID